MKSFIQKKTKLKNNFSFHKSKYFSEWNETEGRVHVWIQGRVKLGIGLAKKSEQKKRYDDDYHQFCDWSNFSLSCRRFCLSLSLFNLQKTFSYVFHFHNLSKRHSEKTIFLLICCKWFSCNEKKKWKKRFGRPVHFNLPVNVSQNICQIFKIFKSFC